MLNEMLEEIMKDMVVSICDIIRNRALVVMESYRSGCLTLDEAAESIGALSQMDHNRALAMESMRKVLTKGVICNEYGCHRA